ncbi:hypothetical protein [Algivirga pacifica]|uniref:Uncharacterized protein n=1 Tax=Algivirga pacifica TaxID=1162670 RepID=A0ABP9DKZ8_9BACT
MNDSQKLFFLIGYLEALKHATSIHGKQLALVKTELESIQCINSSNDDNLEQASQSPESQVDSYDDDYDHYDVYDDHDTYEKYNGSWAQDVEGLSDRYIDDAFGGEPDAYWNID